MTDVAHCDRDENVKGVWRFGNGDPQCYYPLSMQGQLDEEWGQIMVEGAGGSGDWEIVVDRLTHSTNGNDLWFVLLSDPDSSLREVFDENSAR